MTQAAFGPQAESRAWYSALPFYGSPMMEKIPHPNPGVGNGTMTDYNYESFIWYQVQLILNDGNGHAEGTTPIDWGYSAAYLENNLTWNAPADAPLTGTAGLMVEWTAKQYQAGVINGNPYMLINWPAQLSTWSDVSPAQKLQILDM